MRTFQKKIYRLIKPVRLRSVKRYLDPTCNTLLEVGAEDEYFLNALRHHYDVTQVDVNPNSKAMCLADVERLSFSDRSFDIVMCLQVLEHTLEPVQAILELPSLST